MTTARERAREAAKKATTQNTEKQVAVIAGADAASDIWEPLVRESLRILEIRWMEGILRADENELRIRLVEALGE